MKAVLLDCAKIESLTAHIYQQMAGQSGFCDKVRETFARLAEDEREHAAQLEMVLQFPEEKLDMVKRISWEKVAEGLDKILAIGRDLESFASSEEDALKMAIDLENRFINIHLNNAVHFSEPRVAELFEHLGRGDEAHLCTLKECLTWWHANRSSQK